MFGLLLILWYCYDDWLASKTSTALGDVPLAVWLIVMFLWLTFPLFNGVEAEEDDEDDGGTSLPGASST